MSAQTASTRSWRAGLGNALVLLALFAISTAFGLWQTGDWWVATPHSGRWLGAGLVLLAYTSFCATLWLRTQAEARAQTIAEHGPADAILLAWASQTGFAQQLAEHSASALRSVGALVQPCPLHQVTVESLRRHRHALFIVSTTGEGDPPDHVLGFTRGVLGQAAALDGLHYAVLALGDRAYQRFCGFGRTLDHWLHHNGAQPLFDRIEVDAGDAGALRHWQHRIGHLAGRTDLPDWSAPTYGAWQLAEREWLNIGSPGGRAYRLALTPHDPTDLMWQAGDIAEIGPRNDDVSIASWLTAAALDGNGEVTHAGERLRLATLLARSRLPDPATLYGQSPQTVADGLAPLPHREYSIASLPADGSLQLLVRRMHHSDGRLGNGSGWLTEHAAVGATIDLRIRSNPSFRPPTDARPLILIGNGTGLAGLRSVLKARIAAGHARNWLLFGERSGLHDFHYRDEIERWQRAGHLQHVDLAFSRDQAERRYVQHVLQAHVERLREWLAEGAAIYVCGSLQGMAPGVDAVLREMVGVDALEAMAEDGRYRRDVY